MISKSLKGYQKYFLYTILFIFLGDICSSSKSVSFQTTTTGEKSQINTQLNSSTQRIDVTEIIKRARELTKKRSFTEAENLLRDFLSVDKENPAALYELATILSWDKQYNESIELYRKLLKLQPDNTGLRIEIGRVLLWQADSSGKQEYRRAAIREFELRVKDKPNDCFAIKQIGAAYLRLGELDTAYAKLFTVIRLCPNDEEAARLLAETYAAQEEFQKAIELLRILCDRNPEYPDIRLLLADCLFQSGEIELAEKEYRAVLRKYPFSIGALVGFGRILKGKGQLNQAKEHFQTASWTTPAKYPDTYVGLGDVESMREDWKKAVEYYKQALNVDPQNDQARSGLRQAQWMNGPKLDFEYNNYRASQGLSQEILGAKASKNFSGLGLWSLGYRKSRYIQEYEFDLFRSDYYLSWGMPIADWLKTEIGCTMSDFSENPNDEDNLYGWSTNVIVSPIPIAKLYLSYSRVPVSESFATINSNYYSDIFSGGLDGKISQRFSVQLSGYIARQHGTFSVGYWNFYHTEWVTLKVLPDLSQRWSGQAQISYQVLTDPVIFVRAGTSIFKSIRSQYLPYWAPESFPQEKLALSFSKFISGKFNFEFEARGTHVHEGSEWGYGVSSSLTLPLWNFIEVGVSGSIDEAGTKVPWNGKRVGALFRLLYVE